MNRVETGVMNGALLAFSLLSMVTQAETLMPSSTSTVELSEAAHKGAAPVPFVGPESGVWTVHGLSGVALLIDAQNDRLVVGIHTYGAAHGQPFFLTSVAQRGPLGRYEGALESAHGGSCLTCPYHEPSVAPLPGANLSINFTSPVDGFVSFFGGLSELALSPQGTVPLRISRLLFGFAEQAESRFEGTWLLIDDRSELGGGLEIRVVENAFTPSSERPIIGCPLRNLREDRCLSDFESIWLTHTADQDTFEATFSYFGDFGFVANQYAFSAAGAHQTVIGSGEIIGFTPKYPAMMVRLFEPGYFANPEQVVAEAGAWAVAGLGGVGFELDMQSGIAGLGTYSYERDSGASIFHTAAVPTDQLSSVPLDVSIGGSCLNCEPSSVMVLPGEGGTATVVLNSMDQGTVSFSEPAKRREESGTVHSLERVYLETTLQRLLGKWALVSDTREGQLWPGASVLNFYEIEGDTVLGCRALNLLDQRCSSANPITATAQLDGQRGIVIEVDFGGFVRDYLFDTIGVNQTSIGMAIDSDDPSSARISRGVRLLSDSAMHSASGQ